MYKEIEKAKEDLQFFNEGDYITPEMEHSARILEEYIKQLESEIEMYKDFKEIANMKMGDRNVIRAIKNYKTLDKIKEEDYWKGYIQKQNEAEEICKMCKYRKRYKELTEKESILDKVTEECRKQIRKIIKYHRRR